MKTVISSLALALILVSPVAADQATGGQSVTVQGERASALAASSVHPVRAVLRYDLSTAGACRAWSDQPAELCVLFALHVIHMSEHPPKVL
jgi:hypothetical protein